MNNSTDHFYHQLFLGNIAKEAVKIILEKADYRVEPYGYETTITFLKHKLKSNKLVKTDTITKIRATPDLLVFDDHRNSIKLLEIKIRNKNDPCSVGLSPNQIKRYKDHWNVATLVLAVPCGDYFYVKDIREFNSKTLAKNRGKKFIDFDLTKEFKKITEVFINVNPADVEFYGEKLKRILKVYYKD